MVKRVIFDTNVFISFLIGKRLKNLKDKLSDSTIQLIFTKQLIIEIIEVTSRPKLRKYFKSEDVTDLHQLISIIGKEYSIHNIPHVCRDQKDNFLLALCEVSKADFLVTGDQDLLILGSFKGTRIISVSDFETMI